MMRCGYTCICRGKRLIGGNMRYFSGRPWIPRQSGGNGLMRKIRDGVNKLKAIALAEANAVMKGSPLGLMGMLSKGTKLVKKIKYNPNQFAKNALGSVLKHGAAGVSDILSKQSNTEKALKTAIRQTARDIFSDPPKKPAKRKSRSISRSSPVKKKLRKTGGLRRKRKKKKEQDIFS